MKPLKVSTCAAADESPLLAVEVLMVIVLEAGDADKFALEVVGPAV